MKKRPFALLLGLLGVLQLSSAQSYPPVWSNTSKYVAGDMVTDYGNVYRCIKAVTTPYLDPSKTYANWELNYVRNNTTLLIGAGQTFPALTTAWTNVQNCTIAQGVYLHLNIVTTYGLFTESFSQPLILDHNSGSRISIIGDNASNISLTFPNGTDGIDLDTGHALGSVSNMMITGTPTDGDGIHVKSNASLGSLSGIAIEGFNNGLHAESGGAILPGISVALASPNYACVAESGGDINFTQEYDFNGALANTFCCLYADRGGHIEAQNSNLSGNGNYGVWANEGGIIDVSGSVVNGFVSGITSVARSHVVATSANAKGNASYDLFCDTAGTIDASGTQYTNGHEDTSLGAYILTSTAIP